MRVAIIGRETGLLEVDVGGFTPSSRYLGWTGSKKWTQKMS